MFKKQYVLVFMFTVLIIFASGCMDSDDSDVDVLTETGVNTTGEAVCGNNIEEEGEECDGVSPGGTFCEDCKIITPVCGDGKVEGLEKCDDGNIIRGDGCNEFCRIEGCGNSEIEGDEECDDGNNNNGDGCSSTCEIEVEEPTGGGGEDVSEGDKLYHDCGSIADVTTRGSCLKEFMFTQFDLEYGGITRYYCGASSEVDGYIGSDGDFNIILCCNNDFCIETNEEWEDCKSKVCPQSSVLDLNRHTQTLFFERKAYKLASTDSHKHYVKHFVFRQVLVRELTKMANSEAPANTGDCRILQKRRTQPKFL